MTVCIAAIYNNNSILGASDRMMTGGYGDITFEPPNSKILSITNSIVVMTAGDQNIQMQVFLKVSKIVGEKIEANPTKWIDVSEVAELYSKCFYQLRNKLIENQILSKYNLTLDLFITKQKEMNSEFVDLIATRIDRFDNDFMRDHRIETIITGIDDNGAHIYIVADGEISCQDKLGFAAIGIGSGHANSHFMLSGYSGSALESKALVTIHQAKKKSEVSPGVGKETDMCVIGPMRGTFNMLLPIPNGKNIVKDLDKFYGKYTKAIKKIDKKTENNVKDYLTNLTSPTQSEQEAGPTLPPIRKIEGDSSHSPKVTKEKRK